jgi:hypothetical protein
MVNLWAHPWAPPELLARATGAEAIGACAVRISSSAEEEQHA